MRRFALILAVFGVFSVGNPVSARIDDPIPTISLEQAIRTFNQTQLIAPPPPPAPIRPVFDESASNGACVGAIPLLEHYSPGWDVNHMARIMYRESRCDPSALYPNRNVSSATGLLQLLATTHCPWISSHFGVQCTVSWLQNPHNNVMAAAELYRRAGGNSPWAMTR